MGIIMWIIGFLNSKQEGPVTTDGHVNIILVCMGICMYILPFLPYRKKAESECFDWLVTEWNINSIFWQMLQNLLSTSRNLFLFQISKINRIVILCCDGCMIYNFITAILPKWGVMQV